MDSTIPDGLPKTFSTQQMKFFTGLSVARLDQLTQSGVIDRPAKGVYAADSVVRYINFLRRSGEGPRDWQSARVELAREKLALLKLERSEREGQLLRKDDVRNLGVSIMTTTKNRLLAVAPALAPRLVGLRSPMEGRELVNDAICDALSEIAALGEVHEKAGRRRNGAAKAESR
jgi:hypothetical protein